MKSELNYTNDRNYGSEKLCHTAKCKIIKFDGRVTSNLIMSYIAT